MGPMLDQCHKDIIMQKNVVAMTTAKSLEKAWVPATIRHFALIIVALIKKS